MGHSAPSLQYAATAGVEIQPDPTVSQQRLCSLGTAEVVVDEGEAPVLASGPVHCQEHTTDGTKRPEQLLQVSLRDITCV